ncbi:MAG TPA: nucleotidyltransferase family protein [Burkholderiales bacterium]|nr:nucleotidyltransferase family protein [Burkholderiales bacterium]
MARDRKLISGVLLAAGAGSRFGGGKLLHPLEDGVAIAAHAARNLMKATGEVVAVVRWGDFPLSDMLGEEGCRVVMFQDAKLGMGASLAYGVSQARDSDGWVIGLADMPRITTATINRIVDALEEGAKIAAPSRRGERGHPVGFAKALRDELLALGGDQGARTVLERHRDAVRLVECDDPGIFYDIDRKSDLKP